MKRFLWFGILAVAVLTVAACWNNDPSPSNSAPIRRVAGVVDEKPNASEVYCQTAQQKEEQIRAALNEKVSVDIVDKSLGEVLTTWRDKWNVPIVFDHRPLKDAAVNFDTLVSLKVSNVTRRSALELLFDEFQLDWYVDKEALRITHRDESEKKMVTRVYPVGDLFEVDNGNGPDFEFLIDLVTSTVSPPSWDTVGGSGSIKGVGEMDCLTVSQTWRQHEQVLQLLNGLRNVQKLAKAEVATAGEKNQNVTKSLKMSRDRNHGPQPLAFGVQPVPEATTADEKTVAYGNNQFACDLYAKLKTPQGNFVYSPFSMTSAFGMLHAGARGKTAEEIGEVFHFSLEPGKLPPALGKWRRNLSAELAQNWGVKMVVANRLFCQQGHRFLEPYRGLTRDHYGADIGLVDFFKAPEESRKTIND